MTNKPQNDPAVGCPLERRVSPLVAVLAGNWAQFREWENAHKDVRAVFCNRWPNFAGLEFSQMIEIGTFKSRKDALELWQRVAPMIRANVQIEGLRAFAQSLSNAGLGSESL